MSFEAPENPLTDREERIVQANAELPGETCPNEECDLTVDVCDLTDSSHLFVVHEEDGIGLDERTPVGEKDGCVIDPVTDPTL